MWVYGDRSRPADPRAVLADLERRLAVVWNAPPGLERHGALATAFVRAGELAQGLADAAFQANGDVDDLHPEGDAAMQLLRLLARALDRSWRSGFAKLSPPPELSPLSSADLPVAVMLKQAEGFAFYALYPEAYLEVARQLSEPPVVIGLRSIGAPLAALVAAASGADSVFTVRPVGPPFERTLSVAPRLEAAILARPGALFVIADEGPGLSGSSFGGAADWLERRGVPRERIVFFPSHGAEPGVQVSAAHLDRWRAARRPHRTFDDLFLADASPTPLARWFEDLTGPAAGPLQDLSGGAWRSGRGDDPPAWPSGERRKFRLRTASGDWLLKFVGLDAEAKYARARALHHAGFTAKPLALRNGMLLERWAQGAPAAGPPPLDHFGRYLSFRARTFPADRAGASLLELASMARRNIGLTLGDSAADVALARWSTEGLAALQAEIRPIHTDGRLHLWEWLDTGSGWLKTDALDHSQAHDLVGPQDVAWDVAGAIVELELDRADAARLQRLVRAEVPLSSELVDFLTPCYLAFQVGLWTFASAENEGAARWLDRCLQRLRRLLDGTARAARGL